MTGAPAHASPAGLSAALEVHRGSFHLDLRFQAAAGEIVGVVGPNGAGKTTLLRALAGLTPLTAGRIELAGRVLAEPAAAIDLPTADRQVGLLFQDYRLFPHLSARDNVAFGLRARGVSRRAARQQANSWLASFDLTGCAERRPAELSGGQAQRVALARTLAPAPRLLLLDEPLAALDAAARPRLRAGLRHQLAGYPGPCLLVTHDPLEALVLADRLLVLDGGKLVQEGTSAQVAQRPASSYVGQLLGLNVLEGVAVGGVLTTASGGQVHFAGDVTGAAIAVLRPSAVTVHAHSPAGSSARNVWSGTLQQLEPLGDRVRASIGGAIPLLADLTVAAVRELDLQPGRPVWVSVKATDVATHPATAPVT